MSSPEFPVKSEMLMIRLPFTEQQDQNWNCGPQCLRTAARYFGVDVPLGVWENDTGALWDPVLAGASWDGMLRAAKLHGLKAKLTRVSGITSGMKLIRRFLTQGLVPIICIEAYKNQHFVIPVGWATGNMDSIDARMLFYDSMMPPGMLGTASISNLTRMKRWDKDLTILVLGSPVKLTAKVIPE